MYLPFGVDPLPCLALSVQLPLNNCSPSPVLSCGAAPEHGVCWTTQERCRQVFRTRFLTLVRPGEEKKVTRYQNNQKFSLLSYTPGVHLGFAVAALIQMRPRVQVGGRISKFLQAPPHPPTEILNHLPGKNGYSICSQNASVTIH